MPLNGSRPARAHRASHVARRPCYVASVLRLVVFDLDGTLIDSRRDLAEATNALLEELGAVPLTIDEIGAMVGDGAAMLVRRALAAARRGPSTHVPERSLGPGPGSRAALARFLELYDERLLVNTRPYEGIPEALAALKKSCRLAVLTNKPARPTAKILEALGLDAYFDAVIGGDTAHGRKPDPAGLLQLIGDAGATAETTVLVGDSPIDRETARRAGTRICLARYGFGYTFRDGELGPDELFVDRPHEIPAVLNGRS
jgi:phosphoglycolate phosphatase